MIRCALIIGVPLALLLFAGGIYAARAQNQPAKPAPAPEIDLRQKPAYWREPRLEVAVAAPQVKSVPRKKQAPEVLRRLPFDPSERQLGVYTTVHPVNQVIVPARKMLEAIHQRSGLTVLLRGDWMREPLAFPRAETQSAREWMDGLAEAFFGARWMQVGEAWVLARMPTEATWTAMPSVARAAKIRELTQSLFRSITAEQWKLLVKSERVELHKFERPQQQPVFERLRLEYFDPVRDPAGAPGAAAIAGREVFLRLQGSGRKAQLVLLAPGAVGEMQMAEPFFDRRTGDLAWGVPPPR